ncbi:MAG TPA: LEA type 2 family protein [Myxococcaceae bacterium]|nr:LEA type 2 family protein [Myxococcaceae bacterium]
MPLLRSPAVLLVVLLAGCPKQIPSAAFTGAQVKAVQPNLVDRSLRIDLELDFLVRNPLPARLVVPAHEYRLKLGDGPAQVASLGETVIEPGKNQAFPYRFALVLSGPGAVATLQPLLGRDVPYTFEADAKVDLPDWVLKEIGSPRPEAGAVKEAWAQLPAEFREGKVSFLHEGTLRLPKLPELSRSTSAQPKVEMIGGAVQPGPDPSAALAQLKSALQPFVDTLQNALDSRPPSFTLSGSQVLQLAGIPSDKLGAARTALSNIGINIAKNDASITLPINPPTPMDGLKRVDSLAGDRWSSFKTAFSRFNPAAFSTPGLPTSFPQGIKVTVPFRLKNPNTFSIRLPGLRLNAIRPEDQKLVSSVRAVALSGATSATAEGIVIPAGGVVDMALTTELHWDQLGGLLAQLQSGGGPLPPRLQGEIALDVGLGQLTIPIDL